MKRALILVDLQNDFLPGGALAVPRGDEVIPVANLLMTRFAEVVATQDNHPADHKSFAANHPGRRPGDVIELNGLPQVLWPVHCVQGTVGAALAPGLDAKRIVRVFPKGERRDVDSYSGFFDNGGERGTGLAEYLQGRNVEEVYILGLATDYCVAHTARDALRLGFRAKIVRDGCRGVDLHEGDSAAALADVKFKGAQIVTSADVAAE